MDLEDVMKFESSPNVSNDSPSSLTAEASLSDRDTLEPRDENVAKKIHEEGKERRLNRRLALAQLPTPTLSKFSNSSKNETIDLATEDDDPTNKWFKDTFAWKVPKKPAKQSIRHPVLGHIDAPKNVPTSLIKQAKMKEILQKSLARKRREGLEQRRKLYNEDNEHLKMSDDEEEEVKPRRKKKTVKPTIDSDDSENDEDYKPGESDGDVSIDSDADDAEKAKEDLVGTLKVRQDSKLTNDIFDSPDDGRLMAAEDEINYLNDSFNFDEYGHRKGPGSTISWLDNRDMSFRRDEDDFDKQNILHLPAMEDLVDPALKNTAVGDDLTDILSLCSGRFGSQFDSQSISSKRNNDEKHFEDDFELPGSSIPPIYPNLLDSDDEEEKVVRKREKKRVIESDDEDDFGEEQGDSQRNGAGIEDVTDSLEVKSTVPLPDTLEIDDEKTEKPSKSRVVLDSSDEEDNGDEVADSAPEDEEDDKLDDEEEELEEDQNEEDDEGEAPNFDDEDDELAVMKRIQYNEDKKMIKKRNYFDDEASLSGDDVGSDGDDEEGDNEYEAEEGDADDVPDTETIRRQNHRLMLKQEADKEHRNLVKLQDRLLADGDLAGTDTNRTFRFKLRDELDAKLAMDCEEGGAKDEEDAEEEEDEKKIAEKMERIKFRIEQQESLDLFMEESQKSSDDPFERVAKLTKTSRSTMSLTVERARPSLLSKTHLVSTVKEMMASGGPAPKQMYVRTATSSSVTETKSKSFGLKRPSTGSPAASNNAKRVRPSKLSALEDLNK